MLDMYFPDGFTGRWNRKPPRSDKVAELHLFKGEDPETYKTFKGMAVAYLDGLDPKEYAEMLDVTKTMHRTATKASAAIPNPYEERPPVVHQEYTDEHRLYIEQCLHQKEQQVGESTTKKSRYSTYKWFGGFALTIGVIASASHFANSIEEQTRASQDRLQRIAHSAHNLAGLGICANDMRMELALDQLTGTSGSMQVKADKIAIDTAEAAALPCVPYPSREGTVLYTNYKAKMSTTVIARNDFTDFVSANWPHQKKDLQHAGPGIQDADSAVRIQAGDSVFRMLNNSH